MRMPSAWPRKSPPAALKASLSAGAKRKPARIRCWRLSSSKKMSAREDVARLRRMHRVAHPVVLNFAQAFACRSPRRRDIAACSPPAARRARSAALIAMLIGVFRQAGAVEIQHGTSSNGKAASLSLSASLRVMRAAAEVARDHPPCGSVAWRQQKVDHGLARPRRERLRPVDSGPASASSGRIAAIAPASHGCGSSRSSGSCARCRALRRPPARRALLSRRKDRAQTTQPHSVSDSRPTGAFMLESWRRRRARSCAPPRWRRRLRAAATHRRIAAVRPVQRHEPSSAAQSGRLIFAGVDAGCRRCRRRGSPAPASPGANAFWSGVTT